MVESVEFAKFILSRATVQNIPMGETKLHKLLYICDGFMLALGFNFIEERAKAWNYGPVYPKVRKWLEKTPDAFTSPHECKKETVKKINHIGAEKLVDFILSTYGKWTAAALSLWSHEPNSPWELAISYSGGSMNSPINKTDMKNYFKTFLKNEKNL
ncbi:MAG: SocA family protein [Planctomycetaceae bacterium]|jgi:uncharacterized phage-associated protein|nr:SocA family protein [Planctomycetaceae bacterium]